jgi:hypothetical protein
MARDRNHQRYDVAPKLGRGRIAMREDCDRRAVGTADLAIGPARSKPGNGGQDDVTRDCHLSLQG